MCFPGASEVTPIERDGTVVKEPVVLHLDSLPNAHGTRARPAGRFAFSYLAPRAACMPLCAAAAAHLCACEALHHCASCVLARLNRRACLKSLLFVCPAVRFPQGAT